MDLQITKETTLQAADRSWMAAWYGNDTCRPITLDLALFDKTTHYPNGFIPDGLLLRKDPATSRYGPYERLAGAGGGAGVNETQTVSRTATGGTFTITFDGETTATIPADGTGLTAAAVLAAMQDLPNLNDGDVATSGSAGGPITITFQGRYAETDVPLITINAAAATGGTVTAAAGTAGVSDDRNAGHLFNPVQVKVGNESGRAAGTLLWRAIVRISRLPANSGYDAAAALALPSIRYEA
jgi:hypothetical protein